MKNKLIILLMSSMSISMSAPKVDELGLPRGFRPTKAGFAGGRAIEAGSAEGGAVESDLPRVNPCSFENLSTVYKDCFGCSRSNKHDEDVKKGLYEPEIVQNDSENVFDSEGKLKDPMRTHSMEEFKQADFALGWLEMEDEAKRSYENAEDQVRFHSTSSGSK